MPSHASPHARALALALLAAAPVAAQVSVTSPDGRNVVSVAIDSGRLTWAMTRDGRPLVQPSVLGFRFRGAPMLRDSLGIAATARDSADLTWTQPWGEVREVRDRHRELAVTVVEQSGLRRRFVLRVRAFDDGIGFRYELPAQPNLGTFAIDDELTEFTLADDAKAWSIPFNVPRLDRSEMLYVSGPVSRLDSVQTPLTMETRDGRTALVIHEADLDDYAGMSLVGPRMQGRTLQVALAPMADGVKVRGTTPFKSPWRTVQVADAVTGLVPSLLGLKLNPPSRITDTDWIRPMKYVGIWWGMHLGRNTWASGDRHGATTADAMRYIDFAATNGLGGVLVEGWNVGWDGDWIKNGGQFSFTQPYPDYNLAAVARHAREKGIQLIMHNETSGGLENYERQIDAAFDLYQRLGIHALKTGYVTDTLFNGDSHWSQTMVNHHRRVLEKAAAHQIAVDAHEAIHATGERRTWPNMMSREGARGQEYNAWSAEGGNPPEHETILFFTRLIGGPMDFTPGIFDLLERSSGQAHTNEQPRVRTTLAKQLALYVVLYSPLQMAADLPENYQGNRAFQFIRDVAVDWDTTRVIAGAIGDYVVVARRARGGDDWFLGAITDEAARGMDVKLDFLERGQTYRATIYADGPGANWYDDPFPVDITSGLVTSTDKLHLALAPGGGTAIRFTPATPFRRPALGGP